MTVTRLPIDPLVAYIERRFGPLFTTTNVLGDLTNDDVGAILGVNPESFGRWRRRGWVEERIAERIALDLVGHPSMLWPVEYAELAATA